jgi:CHAT domain-containing protein
VTKTQARWVRSDLGTAALAREVQALRCGLDYTNWTDAVLSRECIGLIGPKYSTEDFNAEKPLLFDHARAHKLYQELLGQVADLIEGKNLLLVPSGPLAQLPFQVLVAAAPKSKDHKAAAWLIRDHALTVLPAVSSLKALRSVGPSAATKPMIGFGNPLLDGHLLRDGRQDEVIARLAAGAEQNRRCGDRPGTLLQRFAALVGWRGVAPVATRGKLANVEALRGQRPLPETADELCKVASDIGGDPSAIRLGKEATEAKVKRLSESGELVQYRIVHFATHGALAGQIDQDAEPGLILTPPTEATAEDDGYLSASEVAQLKLDADWVILSACNTAGGSSHKEPPLSGLARAFIYAQARALLVSHWEVDSKATVKLVTDAVRQLAADKTLGRAEAMQKSMLALIASDGMEAHPSYWAPFVVVGEGAGPPR